MARIILRSGKPITIETNGGTYTITAQGDITKHPDKDELKAMSNDKRFPNSIVR